MNRSLAAAKTLSLISRVGRSLAQAVAPAACAFCGVPCGTRQQRICDGCDADLPWVGQACLRCASPVTTALPEGVVCSGCQTDPPPYEAAFAAFDYSFPIDAAIKAVKFNRKLHYIPAFSYALMGAMRRIHDCPDALVPVPLHWRRQMMRGFNQALELSRPLARQTGLPLFTNVIRHRATPFQSGLAAKYRRRNLHDAFSLRSDLKTQHMLIIDDVITTGETCRALATVLLEGGAERVSVLAVAKA